MRGTGEEGSAATEVALLTPVLLAILMVTVVAFRLTQAQAEVADAAAEAARAASLAAGPGAAAAAATAVASENLQGAAACQAPAVGAELGGFGPGGTVTVTVACAADLSDVLFLPVPGTRVLRSSAVEVVDRFRSRPS